MASYIQLWKQTPSPPPKKNSLNNPVHSLATQNCMWFRLWNSLTTAMTLDTEMETPKFALSPLVRTSRYRAQHGSLSLGHSSLGSRQGYPVMLESGRKQLCWHHCFHLQLLRKVLRTWLLDASPGDEDSFSSRFTGQIIASLKGVHEYSPSLIVFLCFSTSFTVSALPALRAPAAWSEVYNNHSIITCFG